MKKRKFSRRDFIKAVGIGSFSVPFALQGFKTGSAVGAEIERFMYCGPTEQNSVDPAAHMDVGRSVARLNFYDGLLRWRDNPPDLKPWLAESYEATPDGLKWTFRLRQGTRFHDGSKLTSADVVYSVERLLALGTGSAGVFGPILAKGSTRALDKYTVEFTLKKPYAAFAGLTHFLHILNKKVLQDHEKDGDWGSKWLSAYGTRLGKDGAGTGSYTCEMFDPAVGFDGVKFEEHFRAWDHPHMEKVGYRHVHEAASRVLGLMKGDYHCEMGYLPYEQLQKIGKEPDVQIVQQPSMRLFFAMLNNQKPPTNDVHFRRAICYAFDYETWIRDMQHNMVERNVGPVPNPMWGSLDPKTEFGYEYNLDKAKEELKKCKVDWKKYLPFEQVPLLGFHMCVEGAQLLQSGLNRIGVKNVITPKSWPTCTQIARKMESTPNLWWLWRSTYYADPHNWIGELFDSEKHGTWSGACWYKNPGVDDRLHNAIRITDRKEREKLYKEAGRMIVSDAPALLIHNEKWHGTFNRKVKGIRFCPVGDANEWRWLYWG